MALYKFTLTPLDKFYFGKEKHPITDNYFMKSNPFPQQTGVLGLTRHFLLLAKNVIDDKTKWDNLIGKKGFDGSNKKYGKISKIYPIFISDNQENNYYPIVQLDKLFFCNNSNVKFSSNNKDIKDLFTLSSKLTSKETKNQLNLKEFYFEDAFCKNEDSYKNLISFYCKKEEFSPPNFFGIKTKKTSSNGIFIEHTQPGIKKSYEAKGKKEDSYFKTKYLKLNKNFSFSYFADINEVIEDKDIFMTFGGEASPYKVSIRQNNNEFNKTAFKKETEGNIFHFLSDSIIQKEAFNYVNQFIGDTQFFRAMKIDSKNLEKLYNINRNTESIDSFFTQGQLLIKKGSIAFVDENKISEFQKALNGFKAYQNIGYNYYKQLKNIN